MILYLSNLFISNIRICLDCQNFQIRVHLMNFRFELAIRFSNKGNRPSAMILSCLFCIQWTFSYKGQQNHSWWRSPKGKCFSPYEIVYWNSFCQIQLDVSRLYRTLSSSNIWNSKNGQTMHEALLFTLHKKVWDRKRKTYLKKHCEFVELFSNRKTHLKPRAPRFSWSSFEWKIPETRLPWGATWCRNHMSLIIFKICFCDWLSRAPVLKNDITWLKLNGVIKFLLRIFKNEKKLCILWS